MHERMCSRSGERQPPVVHGNARARAWRNCSGDIRPTHWRAPAQSRYHHTHGGLTRGALALGESLPACAWRFPLHARSPNHGGLTPAALASECERLSAKLRLLRCTIARAPGAGGVSPPWFTVTHVQVRGTIVRGTSDRRTGERQRSHGTTTPTAGSRPPLLRRNANVCRRNCDFCHARTHMHRSGGVSPPWFTVTHVQGRSRQCRCDCRPSTSDLRRICDPTRLGTGCSSQNSATCISGLRRSRGATPTTTPTAG
jgi:hypothetical protein